MGTLVRRSLRVKPTRRSPYPEEPFGAGILRGVPTHHINRSVSEETWAILAFLEQREREQRWRTSIERAADEARTIERMSDGWRW
jgi:hypothetical protein